MSNTRNSGRGRKTSYLDRTWLNKWTVLTLTPIHAPDVGELRTKMIEFMASDPQHPLCCTLEAGGRRWLPVAPIDRPQHVTETIVPGAPFELDDLFPYLDEHRPDPAWTAPFKVMVGADSITCYFAHVTGDAAVLSPFAVLMARGDVEGLRPLKADVGLGTATRIFLKEAGPHWRQWWKHLQSNRTEPAEVATSPVPATRPQLGATTATGTVLTAAEFDAFKAWRKGHHPELATTALMASAVYLALAAEGIPVNGKGFYTLVDLRRHLPKKQSLRPGNLAKSAFIAADMSDPQSVGSGLKDLVASSRAVPALLSGALAAALRPPAPEPASSSPGPVTMTFNSMMRNPGVEHIPWLDPNEARYVTMSYPVGAEGISVSACAVEGRLLFSASFDPNRVDTRAVSRALSQLRDIPALLEVRLPEPAAQQLPAAIEWIASPVAGNGAR